MAAARILRAVVLTALVVLVAYASQADARSVSAAPGSMLLTVSPTNLATSPTRPGASRRATVDLKRI